MSAGRRRRRWPWSASRAWSALGVLGLLAGGIALAGCTEPAADQAEKPAAVAEAAETQAAPLPGQPVAKPCEGGVSIHCGAAPTVHFDGEGRLWAAFEQDGHVWVAWSADRGATFSEPRQVSGEAEVIETNGENRPKVVAAGGPSLEDTVLFVSWTRKLEGAFKGEIRFARSADGGKSFEAVRTINDDGLAIGHRFESLHVDPRGDLYLAWIDKRDLEAAKARQEPYRAAAVYYAVSQDQGASFSANRKVADHACECCRIAMTDAAGGGSAIFWRHVFDPNLRDHAFAVLGDEGLTSPMQRVSREGWELDGCPHHGPAILPAGGAKYHLAWFTAADDAPTILYGRFDPQSGELEDRVALAGAGASHPALAGAGRRVVAAWKQTEDDGVSVWAVASTDGGSTWQDRFRLATTAGTSDHPLLVRDGEEIFLSWLTEAEGWRLLPVGDGDA